LTSLNRSTSTTVAESGERVLERVPAQQGGLALGLPQPAAAHEHVRPHLPAAGVRATGVGAVGIQPVQGLGGASQVGGVLAQFEQALPVAAAVTGGGEGPRGVHEQPDRLLGAPLVVVPLGQPGEQPGQRQAGVSAKPEAALGLDPAPDAAQRAQCAVEVVGAGQCPRLDDVEQVGLVRFRLPVQLPRGDGAGDRLDRQLPGTVEVTAAAQRLGQFGVLLRREQP
jgi:hypothetical protein